MPFGLGFGESILIFLMLVVLFGPGKLPEIGNALGKGIRDFKDALNGSDEPGGATPRAAAPGLQAPTQAVPAHDPVAAAMRPAAAPVEPLFDPQGEADPEAAEPSGGAAAAPPPAPAPADAAEPRPEPTAGS